jgi:hypothetical protein
MHICPAEIAAAAAALPVLTLVPYACRKAWGFVCRCASCLRRNK